jgi:hypothetical protein
MSIQEDLQQSLSAYAWSSYPLYLRPVRRPTWLRVGRLLGEHFIQEGSAQGRIAFQRRMEDRRKEGGEPAAWPAFRPGWRLARRVLPRERNCSIVAVRPNPMHQSAWRIQTADHEDKGLVELVPPNR